MQYAFLYFYTFKASLVKSFGVHEHDEISNFDKNGTSGSKHRDSQPSHASLGTHSRGEEASGQPVLGSFEPHDQSRTKSTTHGNTRGSFHYSQFII